VTIVAKGGASVPAGDSIGDALLVAVAKGRDDERIRADNVECRLDCVAIGSVANKPLADDRIGQRRERCGTVDAANDFLKIVERKTIAADADDCGGQSGDHDSLADGIDPASISAVDQSPRPDLEVRQAVPSIPGEKECRGTIGPRNASVPASVRVISATTIPPVTEPTGIGVGMPPPRRAGAKPASPKIATSTSAMFGSCQAGLSASRSGDRHAAMIDDSPSTANARFAARPKATGAGQDEGVASLRPRLMGENCRIKTGDAGRACHRTAAKANWPCLNVPTRPQAISALVPIRASAATASMRPLKSGSDAAIIPARNTPSVTRMLSTMLGNWKPMTASLGSPIWRNRPAMAVTMRSASV
jgi:hypothetical protein